MDKHRGRIAFASLFGMTMSWLATLATVSVCHLHFTVGSVYLFRLSVDVVVVGVAAHLAVFAFVDKLTHRVALLGVFVLTIDLFAARAPMTAEFYVLLFEFSIVWGVILLLMFASLVPQDGERLELVAVLPAVALVIAGLTYVGSNEAANQLAVAVWFNLVFLIAVAIVDRIGTRKRKRSSHEIV